MCIRDRIERLKEKLNELSALLEKTIDLDALIQMAEGAPELPFEKPELPALPEGERIKVGVARDEAFCFTYRDNLRIDVYKRQGHWENRRMPGECLPA